MLFKPYFLAHRAIDHAWFYFTLGKPHSFHHGNEDTTNGNSKWRGNT